MGDAGARGHGPVRQERLEGNVALVTGGSRGIGVAIARRLAREGADVDLTYLSAAGRADAVVEEIEAAGRVGLAIPADGAEPKAVVGPSSAR